MSSPPPSKPPRGVKPPKETSGLLMSVMRTLSASESNEQRDRERAKLEKEYKKSDKLIEEYVSMHHEDLTNIMQLFAKLSGKVSSSKERIANVRENLHACKILLSCRHEELKKLWLEGVEHKHMIQLLEEIEQIKEVPSKINAHISKKQYLSATKLLISSIATCDGSLQKVEALKQLRMELQTKKQQLHTLIMQELTKHIYIISTKDVVPSLKRQGSGRDFLPFQRGSDQRTSQRLAKSKTLDLNITNGSGDKHSIIDEDLATADPEQNSQNFVKILVESLILLNKLPDAVEKIKSDMEGELLSLILRTSEELAPVTIPTSTTESVQVLKQFLSVLTEQFKIILQFHKNVVLKHIKSQNQTHSVLQLYDEQYIWNTMQRVLQLLLIDYLKFEQAAATGQQNQNNNNIIQQSNGNLTEEMNLSSYYSRKKPVVKNKKILFKFEQSNVNNFSSSNKSVFLDQRKKCLLVKPDPYLITSLNDPLCRMIEDFEALIEPSATGSSSLSIFINNYVKDIFLGQYHKNLLAQIETITKSSDAWRSITSVQQNSSLDLPKPLLLSVVKVDEKLQELKQLTEALPNHSVHLHNILMSVLRIFKDTCQAAYRGIVQPDPEDKRICSAAWLKDEDINRFLKSLPNWLELEACRSKIKLSRTAEESPDAIRERNIKEAEILSTNLGSGGISAHEIISDINQLKCLAQLQESMEWFSIRLLQLTNQQQTISSPYSTKLPTICVTSSTNNETNNQSSTQSINQSQMLLNIEHISHDFMDLANICLLVLHLEVRVQCFHYLLPKKNNVYIEPKVIELSRVLSVLDEAMSSCLQNEKSKYIFEGIGDVIAKIIMSSIQHMQRIDQNDINKMGRHIYTLQQSIASITLSREISLDQARRYFHILTMQPEEILNDILESGAQYTEMEYMHAITLIHRSRNPPSDHSLHLNKLNDILTEMRKKY